MKPLLKVYRIERRIINWASQFGIIGFGIFSLTHYTENPTGIMILFILCLIGSCFINDEELVVFDNHLEHNRLFVGGLIKRKKKYQYLQLSGAFIQDDHNSIESNILENILLLRRRFKFNQMELKYTDDREIAIKTKIDSLRLRSVKNKINEALQNNNNNF